MILLTTAVAVALYNGARFIEGQLDTIRNQTLSPQKVVFCDDGSKDNTVQIVREYIKKYNLENSWFVYQNEVNLGYIKNFYKAISLCDTDLVFLSDQDDIWKNDKIEKMTKIMQERSEISLLSCKYGIIDAQGNERYSIVEPKSNENEEISIVSIEDIMRAYRWPGMVMCLRKTFFDDIIETIKNCDVAHDLMFTVSAADRKAFYEYSYVGAYHRRHDNNTAREEHRVFKLLNMERKLTDIAETKKLWNNLIGAQLPLSDSSKSLIENRLELLKIRETALKNKSLFEVLKLYRQDKGRFLRKSSFICDIWLVIFGKNKSGEFL